MNTTMNNPAKKDYDLSAARDRKTGHTVREMAEEAGSEIRHFLQDTSEQAEHLRKDAEDRISRHPLQAVAIAALGGLFLGALLRR